MDEDEANQGTESFLRSF